MLYLSNSYIFLKSMCYLFISICAIPTFSIAETNRYISIGNGPEYNIKYDSKTIKLNKNGVIDVWIKYDYTEKGIQKLVLKLMDYTQNSNIYYNTKYRLSKEYFDTKNNKCKFTEIHFYNKDGEKIDVGLPSYFEDSNWNNIVPGSQGEFVIQELKKLFKNK